MVHLPFIDFKTACAYLAHIKLFRPKLLSRNPKLELYEAPVRPNRSEAWATATEEMYVLRVFERKIVRKL